MDLTSFAYFDKYLDFAKMRRSWLELVNKNNYQRVTKPSKKEKEEICHSASAIALQPSVIINVFSTAPCAMCAYT